MANTQASNGSVYVRGAVQTVAALAVVAGGVSWVAGWEYGHLLTTIGLATLLIAIWPPNFSMHRAIAAEYVRLSARSTGEESEAHLQSAVHQLRKLAAKRPGEAWRLAATLDQLWQLLADAERYDDALPIAREAVHWGVRMSTFLLTIGLLLFALSTFL